MQRKPKYLKLKKKKPASFIDDIGVREGKQYTGNPNSRNHADPDRQAR